MNLCWICYFYNGKHMNMNTQIYIFIIEIATGKGISLLLVWNFEDCKPFLHLKQLPLLWIFLIMWSFLVLYHIITKVDLFFFRENFSFSNLETDFYCNLG